MTAPPPNPPAAPQQAGVSLTQDAWRRFRRGRSSMAALGILIGVVVLAVLTPVLPLQPPDQDLTSKKLTPPTISPLFVPTFQFDPAVIEESNERLPAARERLAAARSRLRDAGAKYDAAVERAEPPTFWQWLFSSRKQYDAAVRQAENASEKNIVEKVEAAYDRAFRNASQARLAVDSLVQRAYADAGFPSLGPGARAMVRLRYALFGKWQLNSINGRDKLGRDIFSRIFWGARVSLIVGFVATLVSLVIGVTYGAISGYAGGWVDNVLMRIVDVLYSIPFIFVVIFVITILSAEGTKQALLMYGIDRIMIFYFVVGAIYWLTMARVVRGQVLSLKNELFVEAARSIGVSQPAIVFRHILPNLFSIVIVYLTLTIPRVILFEAFLSFLGLGVEPPDVSWGLLANEGIKVITPVKIYWWLILFPSLAIGVTLFALNFLGDGLRDAFDPRLKNQ